MRSGILHLAILSTLVTLAGRASAQEELRSWEGSPGEQLGSSLAVLGDVNGDGVSDLALGEANVDPGTGTAMIDIRSGKDGALIRRVNAVFRYRSLAAAGDVDDDGVTDLIVNFGEVVVVFSGATGSTLHYLEISGSNAFGIGCAGVGDVNVDGHADFAVGDPDSFDPQFGTGSGSVTVYSGVDKAVLAQRSGDAIGDDFGLAIEGLGDTDGDGIVDFAVGAPQISTFGAQPGYVRVFSGASFAPRYTIASATGFNFFGSVLARCENLDGDGSPDLAVSSNSNENGSSCGRVWSFSGASGNEIFHVDGDAAQTGLGRSIASAGDVNHDGRSDVIAGATRSFNAANGGSAFLIDGRTYLTLYSFEGEADAQLGSAVAGTIDTNDNSFAEVLLGAAGLIGSAGSVTLRDGNDLFLDATPTHAKAGDLFTETVRVGVPHNPVIVVIERVNGTPTFLILGGVHFFDDGGSLAFSVTLPDGLAGLELAYRAYALDAAGKIIVSAQEVVQFE